jgi:hypothetical protein
MLYPKFIFLSLFSLLILHLVAYALIIKDLSQHRNVVLFSCLLLLSFFIFNEGVNVSYIISSDFTTAFISFSLLVLFNIFIWVLKKKKLQGILLVMVFFSVVYVEFLNGAYNYESFRQFSQHHKIVQKYEHSFPFLIKKGKPSYEEEKQLLFDMFYSYDVKFENNKALYRRPKFMEFSSWFEFGIPEGEQI